MRDRQRDREVLQDKSEPLTVNVIKDAPKAKQPVNYK